MEDSLKQRLLGAIVIIGLAIIFLPAILDRDEDTGLAVTMEMPPRPQVVKSINVEKALDKEAAKFAKQAIEVPEPLTVDAEKIIQKKPSEIIKEIKAADQVVKTQQQVDKPVKTVPASKPKPVEKAAVTVKDLWVVQLGSFSKQENAQKLKQKLIKDYRNLYIEHVQVANASTYRLRMGDFENKEKAIKQRRDVKDKHSISGVVMAKE